MYNKTEWESELGTGLNRFHDAITGNTLELTRQPTSVTRAGTIVTVDRLNNIEDGIEALDLGKEDAFTKNTAFNKNFGTEAGTVTQGNDSRLTNSREWTATTISQAEAEAGTSTTRRAFTAQRVKQAITKNLENVNTNIETLEEKTLLEDTITSSNLTALNQTPRSWRAMTTLGTDVYACVTNGDIYKQINGTGNFIALGQTSRGWAGMTTLGNDVYACVLDGDIYKQTNGTGNFIALGQEVRNWRRMTTLGTDVYACVSFGDIYKQVNGTGNFIALGQPSSQWRGMTTLGTDVYACVADGDIYKQTNGTGNFIALGQTSRGWAGMTTLGNDVYAGVFNGDIYKQINGTGNFIALGQTSRGWFGMTTLGNDVYASVFNGDIYKGNLGTVGDTSLRTYNLNSTSPITIYPTADIGEPKTFRKISSDTNVITITLPTGHTFSGGGQSITLTNRWEEVAIERVSGTVWTATQGVKTTDSPTFNELTTTRLNAVGTTSPITQQAFDGNTVYRRFRSVSNGGGAAIFASYGIINPQWGNLYAFNIADPTIFCRYSLYKEPGIAPVTTLIQNGGGLVVQATNSAGTIALNDTSTNIKMIAEIIYGDFA